VLNSYKMLNLVPFGADSIDLRLDCRGYMVIFAWIKGVKNEQETHFTGSIESDPIDFYA